MLHTRVPPLPTLASATAKAAIVVLVTALREPRGHRTPVAKLGREYSFPVSCFPGGLTGGLTNSYKSMHTLAGPHTSPTPKRRTCAGRDMFLLHLRAERVLALSTLSVFLSPRCCLSTNISPRLMSHAHPAYSCSSTHQPFAVPGLDVRPFKIGNDIIGRMIRRGERVVMETDKVRNWVRGRGLGRMCRSGVTEST